MKVKFKYSEMSAIPAFLVKQFPLALSVSELHYGGEYTVYSITLINGYPWFCICDDAYTYWPRYRQGFLFDVVDSRLSRYWEFFQSYSEKGLEMTVSFQEWVLGPMFYTNLIDGEKREIEIFNSYKEKMDMEFEDDSVELIAKELNSEWLLCPICVDGWEESNTLDALVKCPVCQNVMNNPRYVKRLG